MSYQPGDKVTVRLHQGDGQSRNVDVTVIEQASPGAYRCGTNMGITIVIPVAAPGSAPAGTSLPVGRGT